MTSQSDTIAAIATPPGRGGVGVIRISGQKAYTVGAAIGKKKLIPRYATYTHFYSTDNKIIDSGLILYFKAPHSFTGEDVVEIQAHGGPVILDILLKTILTHDDAIRMARPGEFSERAFLNNKIDLAQAEAIADLINAQSQAAALSATRSLQGEFSKKIYALVEDIIHLRMFVEAAIDFPEEEIDFLQDTRIEKLLEKILLQFNQILVVAKQGTLLTDGISIAIAGKPNAGKSSLLNALCQEERAIVTDIPGTTRDVIKAHILCDGLPVHILDTAGLRDSKDSIEQEGIKRARLAIKQADCILIVVDMNDIEHALPILKELPENKDKIVIFNKIDKQKAQAKIEYQDAIGDEVVFLSAKEKVGIDLLIRKIKQKVGFSDSNQSNLSARRRHLDAIEKAQGAVYNARQQLIEKSGELVAEELKMAGEYLGTITGKFTSDDLLGEIFSNFCIGK